MLSDLFNDPSDESSSKNYSSYKGLPAPPSKRKETNLCGIKNQGATCYLNTLIQTLFFTREFRENLFSLTGEELGLVPGKNGQQAKLRVIPVELQRLFGQLLLIDQDACSTNRLTDSFGWTNNEELQQHDVQELNRILFSAIEQSLVNTKQSKLIQELYRGTCINKIRCLTCLNIFEREEEFLDLPITVQGSPDIHMSLSNSYILRENLNGNNQYKCEKCNNQYRDAEKYCQLKSLPPILTLSLLRFTYDLTTFQRIKETDKFEFPLELDLKEYMEDRIRLSLKENYTEYELFSVIIHSGSAYGGHYHCYIRDFDNLGKWILAENNKKNTSDEEVIENLSKEICLICLDDDENSSISKELVNLDYLKYDKPLELLKAFIYNKNKYEEFKVESVCADLTKVTGVSWNKRFRNKYGPIEKFLRKHEETFELSADGKYVKLKPHDRINIVSSSSYNSNELIQMCLKEVDQNKKQDTKLSEEDLLELDAPYHWYDFDDSKVTPIFSSTIKKQFEGKESAYMLFYRRKSENKKENSRNKLPKWLIDEIENENLKLKFKREEYEASLNSTKIECYLENDFYLEQNVLNLKHHCENQQFFLSFDKRTTTVNDLKEVLAKYCIEQEASEAKNQTDHEKAMLKRKETCLNLLFDDEQPFYWFLVRRVDTSSSGRFSYYVKLKLDPSNENLFQALSKNSDCILVFSKHSDIWPIGDEYEPIRIVFKFFDKKFEIKEISYIFTKSSLIKTVKQELGSLLINEQTNYELGLTTDELNAMNSHESFTFNLIKFKQGSIINPNEVKTEKILLESKFDDKSIKDLGISNGDIITVESESNIDQLFSTKPPTDQPAKIYSNCTHKINVINCLLSPAEIKSGNLSSNELIVEESDTIKNIRIMALSSFNINSSIDESHLRFLNEDNSNDSEYILSNLFNGQSSTDDELKFPFACLHDDTVLGEVLESVLKKTNNDLDPKFIFLLCSGRAPLQSQNEIVIKCYLENADFYEEILVDLTKTKVSELTEMIRQKLKLKPCEPNEEEIYYLKTLDWLHDVESVLNNLNILCSEVKLKHNQSVLITKGKLVPPNHVKIKTWISVEFNFSPSDEIVLNDFMDAKYKSYSPIGEIITSTDTKLEDLKVLIQSSLMEREDLKDFKGVRLRLLKKQVTGDFRLDSEIKFQSKKPLIDWHKPLKQLHLNQECDIGIELLEEEEDSLNQGVMLIDCIRFDFKTRLCSRKSFKQIFWNVNNGATLNSLKESILKAYQDELEPSDSFKMIIAKRLIGKYQWILLKEQSASEKLNEPIKGKKKKKSTNAAQQSVKSNLKSAPYYFDDGDLIAFAIPETNGESSGTTGQITAKDFMSKEDLEYANKVNLTAAELSRLRKEKKYGAEENKKKNGIRRPEVGIKIKIDDFSGEN